MKLAEALYRHGDTCMLRIELIIPKMWILEHSLLMIRRSGRCWDTVKFSSTCDSLVSSVIYTVMLTPWLTSR